jgi:hypothetical protein
MTNHQLSCLSAIGYTTAAIITVVYAVLCWCVLY